MRIFRTSFKNRQGKQQTASKWYVEFRDHLDTTRRLPGFTSKAASEELGRRLEQMVEYHRATGGQIDPKLARWLAELPDRIRTRLAEIGLLSSERLAAKRTLSEHLDDFEAALEAKGRSAKHVSVTTARARRVVEDCGFGRASDLSGRKVEAFLAEQREAGMSAATSNYHLQAIGQFCRWLVKEGRATENPMAHASRVNAQADRRRVRRALSTEEVRWLLTVTEGQGELGGLSGPERSMLYRLAVESGLRISEIRSLTRSSFDLSASEPTVSVAAAYSKRRRDDTVPLRLETAAMLRGFLRTKAPMARAFRLLKSARTSEVLRADLQAARVAWLSQARDARERGERAKSDFLAMLTAWAASWTSTASDTPSSRC